MTSLIVSICLSASLFALTLSTLSLVLHWVRSRKNPDIDEVWTRLQAQQTQHLDLLDKVEHWRRRDNVRRARQGAEDKASESTAESATAADYKAQLRARALQNGLGISSR